MHIKHKHTNIRLDQIKLRSEYQIRKLNKNIDGLLVKMEENEKCETDLEVAHEEIKKLKSERDLKVLGLVASNYKHDSSIENIRIITEFIKSERVKHRKMRVKVD